MAETVYVLVTIPVNNKENFIEQFNLRVAQVKQEPGCIEYGPAVDADAPFFGESLHKDDTVVTILEKWASIEDLNTHSNYMTSPECSYAGDIGPYVTGPMQIKVLKMK
ncbi:hypothetical protein CYMTET_9999 [Cymbomonas tetramitiformis]|uniref:ABM domain-containing protein n=1 Tax=Cymbomonas tetramitiformis TaxID=36881 RepID=A0AAE0GQF6_9CHLO|nr:hypothetical protein CYMTET_9999 [Cymbomonas tetramitiformis]